MSDRADTGGSVDTALPALERAPTLAVLAYDHVKNAIVSGELPPSSHHSEASLARRLGISRAPLREALRQLREEGFVEADQRGVLVAPLTKRNVAELYEVRLALEGQAAARAFGHVPKGEIEAMRAEMERIGPLTKEGKTREFIALDIGFHDLWISHCDNAVLTQFVARLRDHIRRASNLASGLTEASYQAYLDHLVILDALEGDDAAEFRAAVESHIANVAQRMATAFPDNGGDAPDRDEG